VSSRSDRAIDPGFPGHGIEEPESFRRQHRLVPGLTLGGHTVTREMGQGERVARSGGVAPIRNGAEVAVRGSANPWG
jgi:hypothetical protein